VALDKTGTITLGEPRVIEVVPFGNTTEREVLETAAVAEKLSEHPLAKAVMAKARERSLNIPDTSRFKVIPGRGVIAENNGEKLIAGTADLLRENNIAIPETATATASKMEAEGLTVLFIASNGDTIGLIGVADIVRDEVRETVRQLEKAGVKRVVMLTGDNPVVAKRIADSVGIGECAARMLPEQKVDYIKKMQMEGLKVAMVGDGVNDAPALAQSDLGIAMGVTATDVAMDTADIVLMTGNALMAAEAISLSRKTMSVIRQNLVFALVFNLIGIAAAATGVLSPIGAALFHNFGSVAVVINSARLATAKNMTGR
jgi:Cu+-exporting ATPase